MPTPIAVTLTYCISRPPYLHVPQIYFLDVKLSVSGPRLQFASFYV